VLARLATAAAGSNPKSRGRSLSGRQLQPNKNSHRRDRGQQHLKSKNYFGAATAPTNVSLSGPTACDGVGAAGDFGRGSEIFWRTSCSAACSSTSGEGATTAVGAIMPEAYASGAGASLSNCSDQFAIIPLAASPYDCQPDVAATPRQNAITKPKMVRPSDGGLLDTRAFSRSCRADISSDGIGHLGENLDCVGLSVELIDNPLF
jgi:hypothetical protein